MLRHFFGKGAFFGMISNCFFFVNIKTNGSLEFFPEMNCSSDELNAFWRSILKNDAASSRIFSICIDDVENEISHPNDRELFITSLESLEIEKGQEDWIMSKPGFKSTSFHCAKSKPVMVSHPLFLLDHTFTNIYEIFHKVPVKVARWSFHQWYNFEGVRAASH